jgi:hypothetical protein
MEPCFLDETTLPQLQMQETVMHCDSPQEPSCLETSSLTRVQLSITPQICRGPPPPTELTCVHPPACIQGGAAAQHSIKLVQNHPVTLCVGWPLCMQLLGRIILQVQAQHTPGSPQQALRSTICLQANFSFRSTCDDVCPPSGRQSDHTQSDHVLNNQLGIRSCTAAAAAAHLRRRASRLR